MGSRVERFEDLRAWQHARTLSREIYLLTQRPQFQQDRNLVWQMRSAARSTMANIAEGFDRTGSREFHKALSVALGSAAEVRSDLYLALDLERIDQAEFARLSDIAAETSATINALRAAVARRFNRYTPATDA